MMSKIPRLSCLVLALSTAAHVFAADAEIPSTGYPIRIDGVMDIAWPGAAPHQVVNAVQGVASKTGCSASWRALWDPQYLYVFVEVNDVELYHDGPATYQDDSVEVFIDIHNDKATSYGTDDYQYRFNWDAKTPAIAMDHGSTTDGIDFAILTTDTGYAFESRFPWTLLYQNQGGPSLGDPMGFEVQINDDDDGGDRDNQIDWYTTSNNTWQNPSLMGTVELVQGAAAPVNASNPKPSNEAKGVWVDTLLTWISGMYADKHDVYFGTDYNDIYDATATSPLLVSNSQSDTTYDPPGLLAFGQTYYWRIDEVNATPDAFVYEGGVWSFTTETYGFYVKPINATASSSQSTTQTGPLKTIDRSGLNSNDQHSTTLTHMWLSKSGQTPVWIQYEFDQVYNLYQMWVWNQNQLTEPDKGYGAKDVTVETSTDGTSWTALANVPQFAQATAADTYVHNTTVDFGGVGAKFVRLNILSNWGGAKQSGLAEVQFSYIPVKAFGPTPVPGTPEVATDRVLTWRPGRKAVSHEVYLGTDPSALSKVGTVTEQRYDLSAAGVEYDRTYYWRVDEVNGTDTWAGDVWSFSTPGYAIVDDFESYNDECKRIFFSWSDGTGHSGSVDCGVAPASGNGTGSTVGKADAPYAERDNVHSGAQAMPFSYDNTSGSGVSEATQTFDPPQDWTQSGVKTLVLFFRGDPANGAGQVYLKINGTQVTYHGSASPLTTGLWNQWNVDLSSLSVQAVSSLTIGVSGTGKGVLYVDDIRLYRQAPAATAVPTDPGTGALVAYYACEGDAKDTSGKAHDGTPMNDPAFADSRAGLGKALWLDGINDHVELPIGNLISTLTSATLSAWFNLDTTSTGSWVRVFDFGVGVTSGNPFIYMFLSPRQSMNGAMRFAITTGSNTAESGVNSPRPVSAGWHHVAVVMDGTAKTLQLILDGEVVASGPTAVLPRDLGVTTQNWLGRSQWSGDGYYQGQIDEFRIYDRALTAGEVRYLAGDR